MSKSTSCLSMLVEGLAAAALCTVASAAGHDSEGSTKEQIEAAVHKVEQAFARAEDPATVSHLLYADTVVLLGQDDTHAARGMQAAITEVKDWYDSLGPNGVKTCKYTLVDPAVASASTFSSFILLHCDRNPPKLPQGQDLRMMYVWKKLPQGWRVQLEMWAPGKF